MKNAHDKIIVSNVTFSYNTHPVLKDVSITIKENEIVTIIGPNGGGKTTLLRLILGLIKPQKGTILIDGKPPQAVQKKLGYVPQYVNYDKKFPITVFEIVLSGRIRPFGYYSKKDKIKAEDALSNVGLSEARDEPFSNLSGGQMQRLLISRALVADTEILMLDEPTSNIDQSSEKHLNSLLKDLSSRMTILLVTHDMGFVANITDRALCVNSTIVEHPFDDNFSEIVSSAYGRQAMIVRHESSLTDRICGGGSVK